MKNTLVSTAKKLFISTAAAGVLFASSAAPALATNNPQDFYFAANTFSVIDGYKRVENGSYSVGETIATTMVRANPQGFLRADANNLKVGIWRIESTDGTTLADGSNPIGGKFLTANVLGNDVWAGRTIQVFQGFMGTVENNADSTAVLVQIPTVNLESGYYQVDVYPKDSTGDVVPDTIDDIIQFGAFFVRIEAAPAVEKQPNPQVKSAVTTLPDTGPGATLALLIAAVPVGVLATKTSKRLLAGKKRKTRTYIHQ